MTADFGYQLGIPKRKKSQLRNCHHNLGLWAYLWGINCWLTWEGPAHCARCHLWAGGPGLFKKVPEQAKGRGQEALFLHSFCFKLLLWVIPQWWPATQKPNEPLFLMLILAMVFITATYSNVEQSCCLATICYLYMLTTMPGKEDAGMKTMGPLCCPLKQEWTLGSVPRISRENKNTKLSKSRPQGVKKLTQDD